MSRGRGAGRVRPAEPQRRCVGCRSIRPQRELLRMAVREGEVVPGHGPGRGCYLCRDPECAKKAVRGAQISRALKGKAQAPPLERILTWLASPSA